MYPRRPMPKPKQRQITATLYSEPGKFAAGMQAVCPFCGKNNIARFVKDPSGGPHEYLNYVPTNEHCIHSHGVYAGGGRNDVFHFTEF